MTAVIGGWFWRFGVGIHPVNQLMFLFFSLRMEFCCNTQLNLGTQVKDFSWFHVGLCQWQYLEPGTIWHSHFPWVLCSVPLWRGIRVVAVQIVQARRAKREAEARQAKARTSQRMEVLNLVNMTGGRAHPDILKRFISLKWLVRYIWYIYNRYIDVGSPCSWDLNGWARLARMATRNKEMT